MPGHILLAHALAVRDGRVLLVASRYDSQTEPLWNLPGGRQESGELLCETACRELREETGLCANVRALAYVSESYDAEGTHFVATIFTVDLEPGDARAQDARITGVAWVPFERIGDCLTVPVVRDPLLAYLSGTHERRYHGVHDAGIVVRWP